MDYQFRCPKCGEIAFYTIHFDGLEKSVICNNCNGKFYDMNILHSKGEKDMPTNKNKMSYATGGLIDVDWINWTELLKTKPNVKQATFPKIKKVIFNDPCTIVFWKDSTKTVVRARNGDTFNEEVGLAFAIAKKALGNKYDYYDAFKKWCKHSSESAITGFEKAMTELGRAMNKLG